MNSANEWAPVFAADTRPVNPAKFSDLANVGAQLNTYGLHAGEKLTFEKGTTIENISVFKQEPRNKGQRPAYLIPCYINGAKTWINPMFFLRNKRVNNQNVPVYPEWVALGDAQAVVKQLIEQGGITAGEEMQVPMADFETDGSPKYIEEKNANGDVMLNDDGSVRMIRATVMRSYPVLPAPKRG